MLKSDGKIKGYLYYSLIKRHQEGEKAEEDYKKLEEVEPYQLKSTKPYIELECKSFNESLDTYFTEKERDKEKTKQIAKEAEIWKSMAKIKENQESRIRALQEDQEACSRKAKLIQMHIEEIDAIIKIINTMIVSGIKWADIWHNIKDEKKRGNPFANMINKLDLGNGQIIVMLNAKEDEASNEAPTELVEIDISLTAYQNSEVNLYR